MSNRITKGENSTETGGFANAVLTEGFLIPMSDFALKVIQTPFINEAISWEQTSKRLQIIENYARFLKQPLKLGMFLRCNDNGNPLSEPEPYERRNSYDEISLEYDDDEVQEYKKAKENVFFENVEIYKNWKYNLYYLSKIEFAKTDFKTNHFTINYPFDNVESIIGLKPKLTQYAFSAIFG